MMLVGLIAALSEPPPPGALIFRVGFGLPGLSNFGSQQKPCGFVAVEGPSKP